jgi:transcriptional regulator with XRE-family HTH domain
MKVQSQLTPEAVLAELGRRIARRRLELGVTQAEVADRAGIGKRTVERIEAGGDTQVSTLVRLLRELELDDAVVNLVPQTGPSPMDLLKLKGRQRMRASAKRAPTPRAGWRWGDET